MIGKAEWFSPRKFGWGLGLRTKESVAYVAIAVALVIGASSLPLPVEQRFAIAIAIGALLLADFLHIMLQVYSKLDEREQKHQAAAERNAAFVAVACIAAYLAFVAASSAEGPQALQEKLLPPIAVLVAMSIAKGATLLYLERKA